MTTFRTHKIIILEMKTKRSVLEGLLGRLRDIIDAQLKLVRDPMGN
jgi:hypothetical protein